MSSSWYRVESLRPRLRHHITVRRHRYRGQSWYVLHDDATGGVHRISPGSYMLVSRMDGQHTMDQLWRDAAVRLGEEAPSQDELIQLLGQLNAADLLQTEVTPDAAELLERAAKFKHALWLRNFLNPLILRKRLWQPDKFFDRTVPFVGWLFTPACGLIWLATVISGVVLAALYWKELTHNVADRVLAAENVVLIALTYPVLKALHELGHGYALKRFGGAVHEMGLMFLAFFPMPYVDASDASTFRSKWARALVGAAGMIVEVFVASLAMWAWVLIEPGLLRTIMFNIMLIAGVSTLLFNANPLLRFDGYYILSDLIEIPNLSQRAIRYWRYLVERYAFRLEGVREFATNRSERIWLFLFAPASFFYKQFILLAIALFVASQYPTIGIAIAVWSLATCQMLPAGKALWQIVGGPRYSRIRRRAVTTTFGALLALTTALFFVPAPHHSIAEGVIWLPENSHLRAGTDGFVLRLLTDPGQSVSAGTNLIAFEEPTIDAELETLTARVVELEGQLAAERFSNRSRAELIGTELRYARERRAVLQERANRLLIKSSDEGVFAVPRPEDLPGRFFKEGQLVGYVLAPNTRLIRATIRQEDADLVRNHLRRVSVKLIDRPKETLPATIVREVPSGADILPSMALGGAGGGMLPVDPAEDEGLKTFERVFQLDIEILAESTPAPAFGSRVLVRFDYTWEPLGQQIWRKLQQLLLAHLQL